MNTVAQMTRGLGNALGNAPFFLSKGLGRRERALPKPPAVWITLHSPAVWITLHFPCPKGSAGVKGALSNLPPPLKGGGLGNALTCLGRAMK